MQRTIATALSGYELLNDPLLNKGTAFTDAERDAFDLHGLLPPDVATLDLQVERRLDALPRARQRSAEIRVPARPAGHQRDLVLRAARAQYRRADADRLHADGRARLPAVQPHLPQAARPVSQSAAEGPHPAHSRPSALRRRRGDRRQRRRAHPRPRRPGRRRHGHPDRQARALHRLRRAASVDDVADPARCRHRQSASARRSALYRLAPRARARRRLRRFHRLVRRRGARALAARAAALGGFRVSQRQPAAGALPRGAVQLQ